MLHDIQNACCCVSELCDSCCCESDNVDEDNLLCEDELESHSPKPTVIKSHKESALGAEIGMVCLQQNDCGQRTRFFSLAPHFTGWALYSLVLTSKQETEYIVKQARTNNIIHTLQYQKNEFIIGHVEIGSSKDPQRHSQNQQQQQGPQEKHGSAATTTPSSLDTFAPNSTTLGSSHAVLVCTRVGGITSNMESNNVPRKTRHGGSQCRPTTTIH